MSRSFLNTKKAYPIMDKPFSVLRIICRFVILGMQRVIYLKGRRPEIQKDSRRAQVM